MNFKYYQRTLEANLVRHYWLSKRETRYQTDGKGADTLNQSTAIKSDLEIEEDKDKAPHLPYEGTLLHMATMETAYVTQETSEPEEHNKKKGKVRDGVPKPEVQQAPAPRTKLMLL